MNDDTLPPLEPLLHQPVRTQLVAFLSGRGEATFVELKRLLGVTDGNLGAHLAKLTEAGYITAREEATGARVQRIFALTASGREALADYVTQLGRIVALSGAGSPKAEAPKRVPILSPRRRTP